MCNCPGSIITDAWQAVWAAMPGDSAAAGASSAAPDLDYLPQTLALRAGELVVQGRTLHNVVAGGSQQDGVWQVNLEADQLSGYAQYRPGAEGRLFARLARLKLPQSTPAQVESLLDAQPGHLPALDIVVDNFELRERQLGRLQVQASNRGGNGIAHEWRLHQLALDMPEATFSASGNWTLLGDPPSAPNPPAGPLRHGA